MYTYIQGPTQVPSLGGYYYDVTFSDDVNRKTLVYCIKKIDVFDTFKKWKALFENETGDKLKCLKSDNGGKYYKKEFNSYCS